MSILDFSSRLDKITSTPAYQQSDEMTQQEVIRRETDDFIKSNPQDSDLAYSVAGGRYKDFRRNTGQGRFIPQGSVNGPWNDQDFALKSEDEKIQAINDFRGNIGNMAAQDPINQEDLSYYYNTVADIYERKVKGEDTGWVADKAYRAWDGFAGFLADAVGASETADKIRRYSKENPKYDEDLTAMLSEGLGSVGASMAVFIGGSLAGGAVSAGNPIGATAGGISASLAANATVRYNEAYRQAIDLGLDDQQATDAGIAAMPAAAIDALSDKLMGAATWTRSTNAIMKTGSTADKIKVLQQLSKDRTARGIMLRASRDAFTEGFSEVVGDYVAGYGSYLATGEEAFTPTVEEMGKSFLVGSILGGGISLGGSVPGKLRGEQATIDAITQETQREIGARFTDTQRAQEAFSLIGQGKYKDALGILKELDTTDVDVNEDVNITSNDNTGMENFQSFTPIDEVQETRAPSKIIDNSDVPSLPFINEDEREAVKKLKIIPDSNREEFENAIRNQFEKFSYDLNTLGAALNDRPVPETSVPVSGIRVGILEEGNTLPVAAEGFAVEQSRRFNNISLSPIPEGRGVADFTLLERTSPEGEITVQPSPGLQTKVQEAVAMGRRDTITSIWPVNDQDSSWIQENNIHQVQVEPSEIVETEIEDAEGININYAYADESNIDAIVDQLDQQYGEGKWIIKDSQGAQGTGIFRNRDELVAQMNTEDGLALNGLYAEPLNPAIAPENRPEGYDYRVHVLKRGGRMEVVPYATSSRFDVIPYLARTSDVRLIEQVALDAANQAAEQASENSVLGIDVVLGADGQYYATELNPTQYGQTAQEYNSSGASGYVRTPYVASAIYSHVKGRVPAFALAGRAILRDELTKAARAQGAPAIAANIWRIVGNTRDATQLKVELLKTYGEKFADASDRIWAAFKESAGQITQKVVDLIQSILDSITNPIRKYKASQVNSGLMDSANTQAESSIKQAQQLTRRNSINRTNPRNKVTPLRIDGTLMRNSLEALDYLESQGVENLSKLIGQNQSIRESLRSVYVFDSNGDNSAYYGPFIRINTDNSLETTLKGLEHELLHAVTETALVTNKDFLTSVERIRSEILQSFVERDQTPDISKVNQILTRANQTFNPSNRVNLSQHIAANFDSLQRFAKTIQADIRHIEIAYALSSPSEFLAALSDSNFRKILESTGVNRNWIQRIIDAISKFFGRINPQNTLEEVEQLVRGIVDSDYKIQVKPIQQISAITPNRVKESLRNLVALKEQKINDNFDANTSKLVAIVKDIRSSDIKRLPPESQERVYQLIDNIYDARSTNTENPEARIDTTQLIDELDLYRVTMNSIYIQERIKDLDGVLDLSGYDGDMTDKESFNAFVADLQQDTDQFEELKKVRGAKARQKYEKKMEKFRAKYREMRSTIIDRFQSAEDYVDQIEQDHQLSINSSSLKEFLKVHYDYLTQLADIDGMEGRDLYAHFFAINNMLDGRWMNGKETTVQYIKNLRDSRININSLAEKFRDPVINHGHGIMGRIDKFNQVTEISQVQLERWSAFIDGKNFLQNDLAGDFFKTLLIDSENAQQKAQQDYLERRKEILQGREMDSTDRISMSLVSRLIQFQSGQDANSSLLKNISNEWKAIHNIVGNPDSEDPNKRQGKGSPTLQRQYKEQIIPIFNQIIDGIEQSDNPMQDFMDSLDMRIGLGDLQKGTQRRSLLQAMQDIQERFTLDNEIVSELFYKKPFSRVVNYLPRAAMPIIPPQENTRNLDIENPIDQFEDSNYESNSVTATPTQLYERTGISNNSYYVNNIEHIFDRGIRVSAITAHTTAERFILSARLAKGSQVSNMINGSDSTYRVDQLKIWAATLLQNAMQSGNPLGQIGEVMQAVGGAYARVALSGLHQGVTQTVAGYVDYQVRTGNILGAMQAASYYIGNKSKMDQWFEDNAQRIVNRSVMGERELDRRKGVDLDENSIRNLPFVKSLSKIYDKAGDIITFSLRKGDDFSIRSLVLAEYHRLLKQKNPSIESINDIDWNTVEGNILTQAVLNIEQNVNASNKVTRGEFFTDRKMGMMLLRNTLFAFSQNVMQLAAQFNLAARDLWDLHQQGGSDADKARAIRKMGAIISQTMAFSASRYIINGALAMAIINIIRDMFDDEDGKIAELALEVEQARFLGDDAMVAQAEHELQGAINIRKTVEKFRNSNLSFESFFKNSMKDSLGTMHFVFNGPAIPQKMVFNVVDTFGEQMVKMNKEEQVAGLKEQIKQAKKLGRSHEVAILTENLALVESQEWLPFEFDQTRNVGMGGLFGSALGGIYSTMDEFVRYGAGLTEININDFILASQSAGLGQADLNRMFRVIDRIEDEEFKRQKTFRESILPAAVQREQEQKKRRDQRELERALREIFD